MSMSIRPHTILPDRLINRLRTSPMLYRLGLQKSSRMSVGVGSGLRFDPGSSNCLYASGNNELPVQQALASCLERDAVFYDIGANVGFFTVIAARLVGPGGSVYAFEPVPENAAYIQLNVDLNRFRNVTVVRKAVSSSPGQGQLWLAEYAGGGALTTAAVPPDATQLIDVDLVSIDDLVFQQKWRPPAVVKIDVEGAEIEVLQGMLRTLREIRPVVLYEIDDEWLAGFQRKYQACESLLTELGYRVTRLIDSYPGIRWIVGHAIASPC
jgi:FkbM family methyltransferase